MKLKGSMCQCAACGHVFTGTSTFDQHRTGDWDNRVCVDPESIGMVKHYRTGGYAWGTGSDENKERYSNKPSTNLAFTRTA